MTILLDIKHALRTMPKAERRNYALDGSLVADGYDEMLRTAPRRVHGYLSAGRDGVPSAGAHSTRTEEHLAIALWGRRRLALPGGGYLRLLDYQFPLKATQRDAGVGKIDLLGLLPDQTLAVVELKVTGNQEDRRIGVIEGLIYAAIVEANGDRIAAEMNAEWGLKPKSERPKVLLLAQEGFWTAPEAILGIDAMKEFIREISSKISIDIDLFNLMDAEVTRLGSNGQAPKLCGHGYLSALEDPHHQSVQATVPGRQQAYLGALFQTLWSYRRSAFDEEDDLFESHRTEDRGPPVFSVEHANRNILMPPDATPEVVARILGAVSVKARHKWFTSLRSSQALCQSVFGGLRETGHLHALAGLAAEDGRPAFFETAEGLRLELEHTVTTLNEPRPTSVDAYFDGIQRVAVEVKLAEDGFGRCSRPTLVPRDSNYIRDYCDGSYTRQGGRQDRCSLTEQEIRYWRYLPQLFDWPSDVDQQPCPLEAVYQLVRNILAVTVRADGSRDFNGGHVLVIYDERNPAFAPGGRADAQYWKTVRALRHPQLLRRTSWQRLVDHLHIDPALRWLNEGLRRKYGLAANPESGS